MSESWSVSFSAGFQVGTFVCKLELSCSYQVGVGVVSTFWELELHRIAMVVRDISRPFQEFLSDMESGGPLVSERGELLAVNVSVASTLSLSGDSGRRWCVTLCIRFGLNTVARFLASILFNLLSATFLK